MENLEDSLLGKDDEELDDEVDLDEDALLGSETDDLVDEFGENLNDKEEDILDIVVCEPLDDLESNEFDLQPTEDLHVDALDETEKDTIKSSSFSPDGSLVETSSKKKDSNVNYKYKDHHDDSKFNQKGRFPKERYSTLPQNRNFRSSMAESPDCFEYKKRPSRYCGKKDEYWPRSNVKRGYPYEKGGNLRRPSWSPKPPQKIHINPHFKSKLIPPEGWQEPFSLPRVFNDINKQDYNYPKNTPWDTPQCPSSTFQSPPPFTTSFTHPPPPHPLALSICQGPPPVSELPPVSHGVSPYHYPVINDSRPTITPMHIPPPTYYGQREPSFTAAPPIYNTEPPTINVMQPEVFNQLISRPPPMSNLDTSYNQKLPPSPVPSGNYHARHEFTTGHVSRHPDPYSHSLGKGQRLGSDSGHHTKPWRGERVGWKTKYKAKQSAVTNSNLHTIKTVEFPRNIIKDLKENELPEDTLEVSIKNEPPSDGEDGLEEKPPLKTCEVNQEEDEQTKELRKEIEIQKRLREELIEKKEARRKAAIMELQKQADTRNSCPTSQQGAGDAPVVVYSGESNKNSSEISNSDVIDVKQGGVTKHSSSLPGNHINKVDSIPVKTTFQ